jgi:hypothetical protein
MSKIVIQSEIDSQSFLASFSKMQLQELELFANALQELIAKKKGKQQKRQISQLMQSINETVLSPDKMMDYLALRKKLQAETITETEYQAYMNLVTEEEELRNQRLTFMVELSQIKQISLPQLMKELGLKPL